METSRRLQAQAGITPHFLILTSSYRAQKQKSRRGIPAPGGSLIDSLAYDRSRDSSVGWSITAVVVSP